jgi:hypothetical protein
MRGSPCFAFYDGVGEHDGLTLHSAVTVNGCKRVHSTALCDDIACAPFAATTLGCNAKLELNVIKAEACTRMAGNLAVGNSVTYTNNHGGRKAGLR